VGKAAAALCQWGLAQTSNSHVAMDYESPYHNDGGVYLADGVYLALYLAQLLRAELITLTSHDIDPWNLHLNTRLR
jgi:hypothetical protein